MKANFLNVFERKIVIFVFKDSLAVVAFICSQEIRRWSRNWWDAAKVHEAGMELTTTAGGLNLCMWTACSTQWFLFFIVKSYFVHMKFTISPKDSTMTKNKTWFILDWTSFIFRSLADLKLQDQTTAVLWPSMDQPESWCSVSEPQVLDWVRTGFWSLSGPGSGLSQDYKV